MLSAMEAESEVWGRQGIRSHRSFEISTAENPEATGLTGPFGCPSVYLRFFSVEQSYQPSALGC